LIPRNVAEIPASLVEVGIVATTMDRRTALLVCSPPESETLRH
jgi:hypothetical protein